MVKSPNKSKANNCNLVFTRQNNYAENNCRSLVNYELNIFGLAIKIISRSEPLQFSTPHRLFLIEIFFQRFNTSRCNKLCVFVPNGSFKWYSSAHYNQVVWDWWNFLMQADRFHFHAIISSDTFQINCAAFDWFCLIQLRINSVCFTNDVHDSNSIFLWNMFYLVTNKSKKFKLSTTSTVWVLRFL